MITTDRIFSPIKLILNDPQDVQDLIRALEDSIHKLDNRFYGLLQSEVSPTHREYYGRMKFLLDKLSNTPIKTKYT